MTSLSDPGDRCPLVATRPKLVSHVFCQFAQKTQGSFCDLCEAAGCTSALGCPAGDDSSSITSEDTFGWPFRTMVCFFLLHGVVLSLASREVLSPVFPLRRATILLIVPSLGSRIIHVRLPAHCVPMVNFRLDRPARVCAAVIAATPHRECPYSPLTGHHLKLRAVSL